MPNIDQLLNDKIKRITASAIRKEVNPVAKQVRDLKREVSRLTKINSSLEKQLAKLTARRAVPEAASYTLHRGTVKGVWSAPPFRPGLTGTTKILSDVAPPPALYFYRVAGVNCAGVEGP